MVVMARIANVTRANLVDVLDAWHVFSDLKTYLFYQPAPYLESIWNLAGSPVIFEGVTVTPGDLERT